ncbi:uncharacterized protein LOC124919612 [Impatiens glandulifera]|uniref:uncharacterized protein LOC124919612 n=1 Tax=Impatiens glandulifera TaxID=253017 RepID=UPI001FB0A9D4|nr:uncharacterized protein LOC124919612 [Impatiens glandulifera]
MAFTFIQSLPHSTSLYASKRHYSPSINLTSHGKLCCKTFGDSFQVRASSFSKAAPATEKEVLKAIVDSDGKTLPGVRAYENRLARLTLVGSVDFEQALTAAAADGGDTASQHVSEGMEAMVVETFFPGPPDENSTISTRLFLPSRRVEDKARKLKHTLTEDILSSTTSQNILAMTFRQVVIQQLWNFELILFKPGTDRNMDDLENAREVIPSLTVNSSDERVIYVLAEVVYHAALKSNKKNFTSNMTGKRKKKLFQWFRRDEKIESSDASVALYNLLEDEIVGTAKNLFEHFNLTKANYKSVKTNFKNNWWTSPAYFELEEIGGTEFSSWTIEYGPAYRLQIDIDRLPGVKLDGWRNTEENKWEILLTHSQMVELANILDMYYEDNYTLPQKKLFSDAILKPTNTWSNKKIASILKLLSAIVATGFCLITISILGKLYLPQMNSRRKYPGENRSSQSYTTDHIKVQLMECTRLEEYCTSIIKKIQNAYGWTGDVTTEKEFGVWIGELPLYLRGLGESDFHNGDITSSPISSEDRKDQLITSAQDIASYQVVMSIEGKLVGFQPTSLVAVNHWAAHPLVEELYEGKKLKPGLMDHGLNISRPKEVVVIELLMSVNPNSKFALARPLKEL